ncbi:MAG TPA: hypothetical protein V6D14_10655 [Coleofasciculaceae cyanobacterium]
MAGISLFVPQSWLDQTHASLKAIACPYLSLRNSSRYHAFSLSNSTTQSDRALTTLSAGRQ